MGKQNVYEHSVRVPLIVAGPGLPRGERRDQLCYIYDIYPTLCEFAGLPIPETVQFQSMRPVFENAEAKHRDHLYFAFMSWQRAVRRGRLKLIEYCVGDERHTQLFDVVSDPDETRNLSAVTDYAQAIEELRALLKNEADRLNDGAAKSEFTRGQGESFWSAFKAAQQEM